MPDVRAVEAGRHLSEERRIDLDPRFAETSQTTAVDHGVGVEHRRDHAAHAGGQEGLGARRRPPVVVAGLQRAVDGRVARPLTGVGERDHLGVRASGALVPALPHDPAVAHDDGADEGVWGHEATAPIGELQRSPHEPLSLAHAPAFPGSEGSGEQRTQATFGRVARPLPSRLSRSVPEFHRVHPRPAAEGSRTLTAGGDLHPAPKTSFAPSIRSDGGPGQPRNGPSGAGHRPRISRVSRGGSWTVAGQADG